MELDRDIILTTINATYQHAAFGLRYLFANLGALQNRAVIREFTADQNARDLAEQLLKTSPKVIGFGVYIWNVKQTTEVVSIIKKVSPQTFVILGGPEVSYETESQTICQLADLTIQGEGEDLFRQTLETFFRTGERPSQKILSGPLPELGKIEFPYAFYTDEDIRNRIIYVEASRGCPYKCEFCLSSLDKTVRSFDLDAFLQQMDRLIERGVRQFKFVDRTFNLSMEKSARILAFFLERIDRGLFLHFELVPDRLPEELKHFIRQFPAGSLQFEIGIQTWDDKVSRLISRRQDFTKTVENLQFLGMDTHVHLHTDLIVGLPGETVESFARGFDRLAFLSPHEIQVGMLKRLRGTPIIRHDPEWEMVYESEPPYTILSTKTMPFSHIQHMEKFAKFWELVANRGHFPRTMQWMRELAQREGSLFSLFSELTAFFSERHPKRHSIALQSLAESLYLFLVQVKTADAERIRDLLSQDFSNGGTRHIPVFLRREESKVTLTAKSAHSHTPSRQSRHLSV